MNRSTSRFSTWNSLSARRNAVCRRSTVQLTCQALRGEGLHSKTFVEGQVAHPLFVGSGWFSYYDQAVTGRRDNENFNIGLVNQQDQPYTEMVQIMKTVNAGLEAIHESGR